MGVLEAAEARVPGPAPAHHSHSQRLLQLHGVLGPGRQQRRSQSQRDPAGDEQPGQVSGPPPGLLLLRLDTQEQQEEEEFLAVIRLTSFARLASSPSAVNSKAVFKFAIISVQYYRSLHTNISSSTRSWRTLPASVCR